MPLRRRSGKRHCNRDKSCPCGAAPGSRRSRTRRGRSRAAACLPCSALLVTINVAGLRHALVTGFEKRIEHPVVPCHDSAAAENATVAGCDGLDVILVENRVDTATDRVGWRALQPPISRVEHKRSQLASSRGVGLLVNYPGPQRMLAPDVGEEVRAE